jgi:hypothetical protein
MARRGDGIYLWESREWERQGMARKFATPILCLSVQPLSTGAASRLALRREIAIRGGPLLGSPSTAPPAPRAVL